MLQPGEWYRAGEVVAVFVPRFSDDTPRIQAALEEVERLRFRIEKMLIMPRHEEWLRREAFVRTAYSSTMVEDAAIPEQEMEDVAKGAPVTPIPRERVEVANYARALEFVDFLSDQGFAADEAAIRMIHWLLMSGLRDTHLKPGEYRAGPNWIEDQGVIVYEPPFHVEVPILMRELAVWLRDRDDVNAVLKAGIAHAHLVAIHPFVDGNGRTGRLLATLLLQGQGYGFRKLLSLDSHYQRNKDSYIQALRQSLGPRYTQDYDFTPWLEFFVTSLAVQAMLLENKLTDWRMMVDKLHRDLAPAGLSERQTDGLVYAARMGHITRKDYMEITGVSPVTAARDLRSLVEKNLLVPRGAGRNRSYAYSTEANTQSDQPSQRSLL